MKRILTALIVLSCMAWWSTAQAGIGTVLRPDQIGIGTTLFNEDQSASEGLVVTKFVRMSKDVTAEGWYQTSGTPDGSLGGLGLHYAFYNNYDLDTQVFSLTGGVGFGARNLGLENTDVGGWLGLGTNLFESYRFQVRGYWNMNDLTPQPEVSIQFGYLIPWEDWDIF
ncbi:MAG: hypothetical protein V3W37_03010 [Candidatus Binatia bacterium]